MGASFDESSFLFFLMLIFLRDGKGDADAAGVVVVPLLPPVLGCDLGRGGAEEVESTAWGSVSGKASPVINCGGKNGFGRVFTGGLSQGRSYEE